MPTHPAHSTHRSTATSPEASHLQPAPPQKLAWGTHETSPSCPAIEESLSTGQLKLRGLNFSDNFCNQLQLPLWSQHSTSAELLSIPTSATLNGRAKFSEAE